MNYLLLLSLLLQSAYSCQAQKQIFNDSQKQEIIEKINNELDWLSHYPFDIGPHHSYEFRRFLKIYIANFGYESIPKSMEEKLDKILIEFLNEKSRIKAVKWLANKVDSQIISMVIPNEGLQYFLSKVIRKNEYELHQKTREESNADILKLIAIHDSYKCNQDLIILAVIIGSEQLLRTLQKYQDHPKFYSNAVALALARNRVEPYYSKQIDTNSIDVIQIEQNMNSEEALLSYIFKSSRLEYINSIESLAESLERLESKLPNQISHGNSNQNLWKQMRR